MPFPHSPRPAVVLFDIDGTLLRRAGPHHRQALIDAVRDVTGITASIDQIPLQGMLDPDIILRMLQDSGVDAASIRTNMAGIVARAQELYQELCPDLTDRTCPGSLELLKALQENAIPAGLVTGNLSAIAWKKMEACGLRQYLHFGAFAEMGETRADLVRLAVAEATGKGWIGPGTTISLVGDHPNDIEAAKRNDIRSVAVCTGVTTRSELEASGPDRIFDDLTAVELRHLLG